MLITSKTRTDRITALYLGWTNEPTNEWLPIAKMTWDCKGHFYYCYTQAFKQNMEKMPGLKAKIINPDCGFDRVAVMNSPHPKFASRIPHRPDSMQIYDLLGLSEQKGDFIAYLARSGGRKATDSLDVFPEVAPDRQGYYHFYFPVYGLATKVKNGDNLVKQIVDTISEDRILTLKHGEEQTDIFYEDTHIGNCPSYVHYLFQLEQTIRSQLQIVKVNQQNRKYAYRLLVQLSIEFSKSPFSIFEFQTLNPMP